MKEGEELKPEEVTKLSDVNQEEAHGYLAEISQAILRNEVDEESQNKGPRGSCILPKTSFQLKNANECDA